MEIKQGEIHEIKYIEKKKDMDGDQIIYREVETKRPVLVISNDIMNKFSPTVIVVGIISRIEKVQLPSHVHIKGSQHNLPGDSIIICEQVRTVVKDNLVRKLSRIDDQMLKKVAKAFSINTFVDAKFFEKVNLTRLDFIKDKPIPVKEDYDNEFKEVISGTPYKKVKNDIKDVCIEYVAAFLNHGGGRLLFGIEDKTSIVKGLYLTPKERDELSQAINNALSDSIHPPISTINYRMEFHNVLLDNGDPEHYDVLENEYVLEILILPPFDVSNVYYTNKNKVFIRYHEQNRELKFNALTEFILNKSQLKKL